MSITKYIKAKKCKGEGQGQCALCHAKGRWNVQWMCFLYEIEGLPNFAFCEDCIKRIDEAQSPERVSEINEL